MRLFARSLCIAAALYILLPNLATERYLAGCFLLGAAVSEAAGYYSVEKSR